MSKGNERRGSIFEIENCERFNLETIKNIRRFRRKIHATYSAWFTILNRDTTWVRMTEFYHHNIKCAIKTEETRRQYSHYETILKLWENKRVDVRHQITSRRRRNNKINKAIFERIRESREINAAGSSTKKKADRSRCKNNCRIHRFRFQKCCQQWLQGSNNIYLVEVERCRT